MCFLFVWTKQPWNFKISPHSPSPGSYHRDKKMEILGNAGGKEENQYR